MAACIDLNPVRAGMVSDPADYRWSRYGEAIGGRVKGGSFTRSGAKGNGKKSRAGLVRACLGHEGVGFEAERWKDASRIKERSGRSGVARGGDDAFGVSFATGGAKVAA
jgi:hypothetical protein